MSEPRAHCYRCDRPAALCLCAVVPALQNRTGLQILQHRHERRHPIGTVRLLRMGLQRAEVHVLSPRPEDGACPPVDLPPGAGLLYPSDDAQDLATVAEPPPHLVVLDGTWAQAHRLYRDNAWIRALPHYKLNPAAPSEYRIRREPRFECLSTLEAVVEAIRLIEPELAGLDGLIAAFRRMIDDQLHATATSAQPGRLPSKKVKATTRAPVFPDPDRVIVAHVEPVLQGRLRDAPEAVLQLVAVSLATGEVFDALVAQDPRPDAFHRDQLKLTDADLATVAPLDEVLSDFAAFCGPAPVFSSWTTCTCDTLRALDLPGAEHVLLRASWANRTRAKVPAPNALLAGLGRTPESVAARGRAGLHLGASLAITRYLIDEP